MKRFKFIIIGLLLSILTFGQTINYDSLFNNETLTYDDNWTSEEWIPDSVGWPYDIVSIDSSAWPSGHIVSTYKPDTIHFNVEVEAIISSEPLLKNEGLQKALEQGVEQMNCLDTNLKNIDSTLIKIAKVDVEDAKRVVESQGLDLIKMSKRKSAGIIISNILTILYIIGFFILITYENKAYWAKKRLLMPIALLISGVFILKFLLPQLILGQYLVDYEFWELFKFIF